ncbi:winged helix-turn-helix transcriptional regulator [Seohaeicola zhoushanensis]|uniref:Transcriptional regulator n=1 Tax=Seohaeicola zhoushanensis TaxID=1569283 RepID=A0A8J3GXB9_9RHOB|nr:helix-turn-helix domain-containing protein [Seohaeicola zhoushanensis]GHF51611.1 transcriptional regulator [Seohaeicola zhoushanensis]
MSTANYAKHLCPIAQALVDLGDQWTLLIVRDALSQKQVRFNELQENLGISRNLLTRRLNQLCEAGILEKVAVEGSKRFAYEPTEKCRDLRLVIHAMARWGEKWRPDPRLTRVETTEKTTGKPVALTFARTEDGVAVDLADVRVVRRRP